MLHALRKHEAANLAKNKAKEAPPKEGERRRRSSAERSSHDEHEEAMEAVRQRLRKMARAEEAGRIEWSYATALSGAKKL